VWRAGQSHRVGSACIPALAREGHLGRIVVVSALPLYARLPKLRCPLPPLLSHLYSPPHPQVWLDALALEERHGDIAHVRALYRRAVKFGVEVSRPSFPLPPFMHALRDFHLVACLPCIMSRPPSSPGRPCGLYMDPIQNVPPPFPLRVACQFGLYGPCPTHRPVAPECGRALAWWVACRDNSSGCSLKCTPDPELGSHAAPRNALPHAWLCALARRCCACAACLPHPLRRLSPLFPLRFCQTPLPVTPPSRLRALARALALVACSDGNSAWTDTTPRRGSPCVDCMHEKQPNAVLRVFWPSVLFPSHSLSLLLGGGPRGPSMDRLRAALWHLRAARVRPVRCCSPSPLSPRTTPSPLWPSSPEANGGG